jgi:hypothetical protein
MGFGSWLVSSIDSIGWVGWRLFEGFGPSLEERNAAWLK